MYYRNWDIWKDAHGVWRAQQHGVTACSNSQASLRVVIDRHIEDREAYFNRIAKADAREES